MWENIFSKMAEGFTRGALNVSGLSNRLRGLGGGKYSALRTMAHSRKIVAGALARGSLSSGVKGSFSRLALAGMASRRLRRRGKKMRPLVTGLLARDFVSLSASLTGLPSKLKAFADSIATSVGGLNQFSGQIAASQGQLFAGRVQRTADYAHAVSESEAFNTRAEIRLERGLLPLEKLAGKLINFGEGALKNFAAYGLEGATQNPLGNSLSIGGGLAGLYGGARLGAALGGMAGGAVAGVEGGGELGALIGSLGGPLGTLIGGAIGLAAGGIIGGAVAHKLSGEDSDAQKKAKEVVWSTALEQMASDIAKGQYNTRKVPPLDSLRKPWEQHRLHHQP